MSVTPDQFAEFFQAVHGNEPFPWQERLAHRVTARQADGDRHTWPECLALPTGSGKTTCLDIALFALACQAGLPPDQRTAPRRIIFVVDRRVIVDEAYEHACCLAKKLIEASSGILSHVADALRVVAGHAEIGQVNSRLPDYPLTCHQLRGGMYRDDAWARTPTQPCVIASTVDQIGSRLLFRSYGRSSKTWAVHAGLAGNDSLIILDEAHCANPFLQTMNWISGYRGEQWAERPLASPFHFVVMSATPPGGMKDVFAVEAADRDHRELGRRIGSSKPTTLHVATKARGRNAQLELAVELIARAAALVTDRQQRIAILVNRVQTARIVDQLLRAARDAADDGNAPDPHAKNVRQIRKELRRVGEGYEVVLLTGRMRPFDRDRIMDSWRPESTTSDAKGLLQWFGTSRHRPALERPAFVVATQCLEVGANLDFDAMVSECASLDALRQRFGRLNRVARSESAPGSIVIRDDQASSANSDPVYGTTLGAAWEWLSGLAAVDFGISAMDAAWQKTPEEQRHLLVLRGANAPVMLPAYVDCWVQTSPEPEPSPDVSLFLHGPQEGAPEVQVCWRADVPLPEPHQRREQREKEWEARFREAVALCPPTIRECLPVPLWLFRRWLNTPAEETTDVQELADVDSRAEDEEVRQSRGKWRLTLLWRGPDDSKLVSQPDDLRPGDTVVVPARLRGWDSFGTIPAAAATDVAEECFRESRGQAILRLQPDVIESWSVSPEPAVKARNRLADLLKNLDAEPDAEEWRRLLDEVIEADPRCPELSRVEDVFRRGWQRRLERHPFAGVVVRGPRDLDREIPPWMPESYTTEDDTSCESPRLIPLKEHCDGVAQHAAVFGQICGLPDGLARTMRRAGELHDIGKADVRFQAVLHGGSLLRARMFGQVLAKSQGLPVTPDERRNAGGRASLPDGFRHELLSWQILNHLPALLSDEDGIDRDLLIHLVTSHHGYGRPFVPVVLDDDIPSLDMPDESPALSVSACERRNWIPPHRFDSGVADRFWRLVRRYGWWGLAWLESIFVLADYRRSELESFLPSGETDDQSN